MNKHLYDSFAEKWYRDGTIYIYSDPHFGDLDSYQRRFPDTFEKISTPELEKKTVAELDALQIRNINLKCGKRDTLILLGDIGDIECVKKLKAGYKVLIMGNHDKGITNYRKITTTKELKDCYFCGSKNSIKYDSLSCVEACTKCGVEYENCYIEESNGLFDEVYEESLQIGPKIMLSHEPVEYPYCLNIHGHVHAVNPLGPYTEGINCTSHFNCCAEQINYKPVCLTSLVETGIFKNIKGIHKSVVDRRVQEKALKEKGE